MQRRVLLGAGALVVVAAFFGLRSVTRHQASQVVDQGIDAFLARLPPGYAVRHGMVDYNPLTSAATVHSVVLTHDGATIGTADAITVSGGNDQALRDVFDPAAYPGGKPAWTDRRLLIADASARNVHLTQGTHPGLAIGRVTLHRLSGRPFMLPPTPENRARPDFLADAALALSADSVQADDTTFAAIIPEAGTPQTGTPEAGAPAGSLSVGSQTISDYDGGKLGSFAVKAFAMDWLGKPHGPPFRLTLDAFDLKTANMRGVLEAIRQSGHADRGMFGGATYESAGLSGLTLDVTAGPHIALADMHASQVPGNGGPTAGTGAIHGLTVATGQTAIPPAAAVSLAAFGMNALTMDVDATSTLSAHSAQAGGQPSVVSEDIVLRGLGTFHVKANFSGYDAVQATPAQPMAALMATTLHGASVVYEDHSLVNRLLAVAGAQMHTTPDMVRAQLAVPVLTLGMMLPSQPDAAEQLTNFLDHPGTLTVTMTPPQGTTLAQIAQAPVPARAQMLGVHIKADPGVP